MYEETKLRRATRYLFIPEPKFCGVVWLQSSTKQDGRRMQFRRETFHHSHAEIFFRYSAQ